ncbi:MAG: Gfo/Idh/MocA family protein, partial [Planctomycetota bacterium]
RELECFPYEPGGQMADKREGEGVKIPLRDRAKWSHAWLVEKFVRWLDGGPPMETNVEDNLQSVALIFAAIESSRTGQLVPVQEFLRAARAAAD